MHIAPYMMYECPLLLVLGSLSLKATKDLSKLQQQKTFNEVSILFLSLFYWFLKNGNTRYLSANIEKVVVRFAKHEVCTLECYLHSV